MVKNFKLIIEYDGGAYHGWQRQKNERTIQADIEQALGAMTGQAPKLIGSGRTDAGVHALGQAAHFRCDTDLTADVFLRGLNSLLSDDIVIHSCRRVDDGFHARYDAKSKLYQYRILNRDRPKAVGRQYVWFIRQALDCRVMRACLAHLIGRHDFKTFQGSGSPRSSTIRTIMRADLSESEQGALVIDLEADGFLKYMVRSIVGTVVEAGRGKITPLEFKSILASGDRSRAGATAPAKGLFLVAVTY